MVSTVQKPHLYEQAYDAVRELILAGTLRAGEVISELRLAETIGVGRTPVREAVRRLAAENILEFAPGSGLRVPLPTSDDFAEVYLARAALEAEAARIATTISTETFFQDIEKLYEKMSRAVIAGDTQSVIAANGEFHGYIVNFAENKRISALLKSFEHLAVQYRNFSLTIPEHSRRSLEDHRNLIDLIRGGDANVVADFARNHILRAGGRVIQLLRSLEGARTAPGPTAALLISGENGVGIPETDMLSNKRV